MREEEFGPVETVDRPLARALRYLGPNGFYELAYSDWNDQSNEVPVICVHGLTRNGRDFDFLADALATHRRVVCPDMPGRGQSQWLPRSTDYVMSTYLGAVAALIARTGAGEIDWVGTSMGGIIGMMVASLPNSPIRKLVLNDIGPLIAVAGLERLSRYVGADPSFESVNALEQDLRVLAAPFGALTADQWRHLASASARAKPDGTIGYAYDPLIGEAFKTITVSAPPLWAQWDAITASTLVLRGAESDILESSTAAEMSTRGPRAQIVEFSGVGHAPALMSDEQIAAVCDFLLS